MGVEADRARAEKARQLRYQRPACMSLNWQRMREDLSEMSDDIGAATWMDGKYELLSMAMDDSENELTVEFETAFGALQGELDKMYEDMRMIEDYDRAQFFGEKADDEYDDPPKIFDMFFPAIGLEDCMIGFDIEEHDYYGIECGMESYVKGEARKRLKRLTKDELLDLAGACMNVARQYMSLKARFDGLNASIDILKGRHEETLRMVKGIEELYDAAESRTEGFRYNFLGNKELDKLDAALANLPDRFWVE